MRDRDGKSDVLWRNERRRLGVEGNGSGMEVHLSPSVCHTWNILANSITMKYDLSYSGAEEAMSSIPFILQTQRLVFSSSWTGRSVPLE